MQVLIVQHIDLKVYKYIKTPVFLHFLFLIY